MRDQIAAAMKTALKDKDQTRLATLRLMNAAIKDRDIAARTEGAADFAADAEILQLLRKMIKQREESAKAYEEGGRLELADQEQAEIAVILDFLPKPLTEAELDAAVTSAVAELKATGIRDMGKVMALLKQRHAGQLDGAKASGAVKKALGAG